MTTEEVQVLVVDDQATFRSAARAVLERLSGFVLVGEAASGEEAVEMAARLTPDLVLMDINLGEMDGIEATRRITGARVATRVVLLSTYAAADLPSGARTCGAVAYLNKDELGPREIRRLWEAGGDPGSLTG